MAKPTLISDVRSVLRRSLPETEARVIEFNPEFNPQSNSPRSCNNVAEFRQMPDDSMLTRARQVMQSLQAATALSHLFPGTPLLVLAVPQQQPDGTFHEIEGTFQDVAPLPMREVITHSYRIPELAAVIRSSFVEEFQSGVPAAAEALLAELGVIERQDRSYYLAEHHEDDEVAAYNYRQRRRKDILAELLEMKRGTN